MAADDWRSLVVTPAFLRSLLSFPPREQARFMRALELLDADERHPSLRVHALSGDLAGLWSVSASDALRMTFVRLDAGRKAMVSCSRHYA